jgi:hypothetical protein
MLDTNVGDMPLDIFADYISDTLDQEWHWEYLALTVNGQGHSTDNEDEVSGGGYYTMDYTLEVVSYGDGPNSSMGISLSCYNDTVDRYYGDGEVSDIGNGQNFCYWLGNG